MILIDADKAEMLIRMYDTDDKDDKRIYNAAYNIINSCTTIEACTWQQISQVKYEIYKEVGNIDRSQYTTERAQGRADGIIFALGMALGIIGKYCNMPEVENDKEGDQRKALFYGGVLQGHGQERSSQE